MPYKKYFFITIGFIFLFLGIIGIFLPLLPSTPFLILTAFCFNRGSDKFHTWLMHHPLLSPPLLDWQKNRRIRRKYKILTTLTLAFSSLFVFTSQSIPKIGYISFILSILGVLIFVWTRKE
ncbi:MAG: YbaN family protein [Bacteriovoracaceae bacterium]|nr:YbaN family protein [Bacteriovoracaceae bacterium]